MANYNSASVLWIDSDLENAITLIDKIKTQNINVTLIHPEELSRELEINHDLAVISLNKNISDLAKLKAVQASQGTVIPIIARVCRHNFELGIENDLTKVMINQQISSLGFQLTLNTRNKVLSAYKDIMSMPV